MIRQRSMFKLWLDKMLGIQSPYAKAHGYDYAYDLQKARMQIEKAIEKAARRNKGDAG